MADLTQANSTWAAGTVDTASTLVDNVDQTHAQHVNGPNSAVIAIENALGTKASLIGTLADLATRLAVQMANTGIVIAPGIVVPYAGSSAPTGWLLCDGSAVSRTTYATLFTNIGTTWGAGDGSTTFNVPDLRGRVAIGVGQGSGLTNRALADSGGEETHTLTAAESGAGSHSHTLNCVDQSAGGASSGFAFNNNGNGVSLGAQSSNSASASASTGHNNMQPYKALNYIIRT